MSCVFTGVKFCYMYSVAKYVRACTGVCMSACMYMCVCIVYVCVCIVYVCVCSCMLECLVYACEY